MSEMNQPQPDHQPKPPAISTKFVWSAEKFLLPVAVAVLAGSFGFWLNSKKPYLSYSVGEVIQFTGEKDEFGLLLLTIKNEGSKEAEDVRCVIELENCAIQDVKAGPRNLTPATDIKKGGNEAHITVNTLNPSEELSVMIKATKPHMLEKDVKATVRGKGINGEEKSFSKAQEVVLAQFYLMLPMVVISIVVLTTTSAWIFFKRYKSRQEQLSDVNRQKVMRFIKPNGEDRFTEAAADTFYAALKKPIRHTIFGQARYELSMRTVLDNNTVEYVFVPSPSLGDELAS